MKELLRCSVIVETEVGRMVVVPFKLLVDPIAEGDKVAEKMHEAALAAMNRLSSAEVA